MSREIEALQNQVIVLKRENESIKAENQKLIRENLLKEQGKSATDNFGDYYLSGMYMIPQLI